MLEAVPLLVDETATHSERTDLADNLVREVVVCTPTAEQGAVMDTPSLSVDPKEIVKSRREAELFVGFHFARMSLAQREEVVQEALLAAWRVSRVQQVLSFPGLVKTIAWRRARRVAQRARHRANATLRADPDRGGSTSGDQEAAAQLHHDLPLHAVSVSRKLGGRQPKRLENALIALVREGRSADEVAAEHAVDRGLLCRARVQLIKRLS